MSHWDTPDTAEKAEALAGLMETPLKARFAQKHLAGIAGSDVLADRIDHVCLSSPYSDVREIIANWLEQIVFSWQKPLDVVHEDALAILSGVASTRYETDRTVKALAVHGEDDLRQILSDVGLRHRADVEWRITEDDGGFDLFALSDDGEMYRFSKIDGGLIDIHPENMGRYASRFHAAHEAMP